MNNIKKHIDFKDKTNFIILAISFFYLLRDLSGVEISYWFMVGVFAIAFILTDMKGNLSLFTFSMALTLPGNPIRLLYIISSLYYLYQRRLLKINILGLLCIVLIIGTQIINFFTVPIFNYDFMEWLRINFSIILIFIIPLLWMVLPIGAKEVFYGAFTYVIGMLVAYSSIVIMTIRERGLEVLLSSTAFDRLGMGLSDYTGSSTMISSFNTNSIAETAALAVALIYVLMHFKLIGVFFSYSLAVFFVAIVLLTKSRTGIVALVEIFLFINFYTMFLEKRVFKELLILTVVLISVFVFYQYMPETIDSMLNRWDVADISNNRLDINGFYLNALTYDVSTLLFGYGINNYMLATDFYESAHNSIVDVLLSIGVIGLISCIIFLIQVYKSHYNKLTVNKNYIAYMPLLVILSTIMAGQYITVPVTHLRVCFVLLFSAIIASEDIGDIIGT